MTAPVDPAWVNDQVNQLFEPLIAPVGLPEDGKSVGILVGASFLGSQQRFYSLHGSVPLNAGGSSAPEDIVMFIGSNTKVFTATLLGISQAMGASHPEASTPVSALLPSGITIQQPHGQILLWHLATHSAGFPTPVCGKHAYGDYPFTNMTAFLADFAPPYEPGKYWVYSNPGFALLGDLLSHAFHSRQSTNFDESYKQWPTLVMDQVVSKLDLPSTQVDYSGVTGRIGQGYAFDDKQASYQTVPRPAWVLSSAGLGAGALSSTLADMLSFLDKQIVPPGGNLGAGIQLTQTPFPAGAGSPGPLSMGLGWQIGNGYYDKNGGLGGYQSYMAFDPTSQIAVMILGNTSGGTAGDAITVAGRKLLGALRKQPAHRSHFPHPTTTPVCPR
jgi:CubicO group peptidase (beta-lactamase class C family)